MTQIGTSKRVKTFEIDSITRTLVDGRFNSKDINRANFYLTSKIQRMTNVGFLTQI